MKKTKNTTTSKTPKPKTLRAALDQIGRMLGDKNYGQDLWSILTALRGPDSQNLAVKFATTAVLRDAAFPNRETVNGSVFRKDQIHFAATRRAIFEPGNKRDSSHFRRHIYDAFEALGLNLREVND